MVMDPVCGMSVAEDGDFRHVHQGETYHFCGRHCLAKFQAEVPPAPFNSSNPFLKNRYADLGSIIQTAKPVMATKPPLVATRTSKEPSGQRFPVSWPLRAWVTARAWTKTAYGGKPMEPLMNSTAR